MKGNSMKYDFSGWATKNDLKCSDGRVIRHGAFKECDGSTVPLVWQHMHDSPDNILGHALLENRDEGVYAYCSFNDTPYGQVAKEIVKHGDVCSLSIYANKLKQQGSDVLHGAIREVSLVLSGANPGALIDNLAFVHSDGFDDVIEDEAIIYNDQTQVYLAHKDDDEDPEDEEVEETEEPEDEEVEKPEDEEVEETEEPKDDEEDENKMKHSEDESEETSEDGSEETVEDVFNTMTPEQQEAAYTIIGLALEQAGVSEDSENMAHADSEEVEDSESENINLEEVFNSYEREAEECSVCRHWHVARRCWC